MISVSDKITLSTSPNSLVQPTAEKDPVRRRNGELPSKDEGASRSQGSSLVKKDRVTISAEAKEIQELAKRDREVRSHEAAHASVGGSYAGSPSFSYEAGPDGKRYAVGGEVPIDTSPIAGDPEATLKKAEQVRAAALAPEQPSAADRRIAAKAVRMAAKARGDLMTERANASQESSLAALQPMTRSVDMARSDPPEDSGSQIDIYG